MICSLGGSLSHGSPVVVFFDRGRPRFWNFYSTILVDVVRVKSYMNCLFDPSHVVIRVTINKLYIAPEWLVSGVVGITRDYIVRQLKNLAFILLLLSVNSADKNPSQDYSRLDNQAT